MHDQRFRHRLYDVDRTEHADLDGIRADVFQRADDLSRARCWPESDESRGRLACPARSRRSLQSWYRHRSAVAVLISAWMPAPPLESEPAMTRSRDAYSSALLPRWRRPRRARPARTSAFVVAFCHDADDGLGAGFAHEQTAGAVEARFASLIRSVTRASLSGAPLLKRTFCSTCGNGSRGGPLRWRWCFRLRQHGQHLKCRDQPSPVVHEIVEDDVAGLFAADIVSRRRSSFSDT